MKHFRSTLALSVCAALGASAHAGTLVFTASSGSLEATATFEASGSNLVVTLDNSSLNDVLVPADILTTLFFDIDGLPTLTPISAILAAGSVAVFDSQPAGGVVGGEWGYRGDLGGAPYGADYGIGSAGLGVFGDPSFPGPDLNGPGGVNGMNYGLLSAGDNNATGNSPVTGSNPFVQHAVVFTFSGLPANFDPEASIGNITFQYGTSLAEPHFPEPGTFALLAFGALAMLRRR